jgi:hypothetical protein
MMTSWQSYIVLPTAGCMVVALSFYERYFLEAPANQYIPTAVNNRAIERKSYTTLVFQSSLLEEFSIVM